MSTIVAIQAIRKATALDRIAAEHPELIGQSTPEEWEDIVKDQIQEEPGKATGRFERQRNPREKRQTEGLQRIEGWVAPAVLEALRQRFPGPGGGIDWNAVIEMALGSPASLVSADEAEKPKRQRTSKAVFGWTLEGEPIPEQQAALDLAERLQANGWTHAAIVEHLQAQGHDLTTKDLRTALQKH